MLSMTVRPRLAAAFLALSLASIPIAAQPDLEAVGPRLGARVPDFTGVDQAGTARSLESLLGPNGAMLVFFRSADW